MTARILLFTFLLCAALAHQHVHAQTDVKGTYRIEGPNIVLYIDGKWTRTEQERVLAQYGMKGLSLDTLWNFGNVGMWEKDGWKANRYGKNAYRIYKPLTALNGNLKWNKEVVVFNDYWDKLKLQTTAEYGFNSFSRTSVTTQKSGKTRFVLYGKATAHDVYLSGTFNGWSTITTQMTKSDSGWVVQLTLPPGKHCYKFIVDGRWMHDPENNRREDDYHMGFNSVYFVTNREFSLKGYPNASSVIVTGSFNHWNERELAMRRTAQGWSIPIYLNDGAHTYRFIVDKTWINDPANPDVRDDGNGHQNSYLRLGEPFSFHLDGSTTAKQVIVAGEFNGWNEHELQLRRTGTGWELPYSLGPGNYQYKYIVDGNWMTDPKNPHTGTHDGHTNSILVVKPSKTFVLHGFSSARKVEIAGNFNSWDGYTMKKSGDGWTIDLYLSPGKCLYKFIVDGKWMIDPGNELWEQNEHGTGNSVLWIGLD